MKTMQTNFEPKDRRQFLQSSFAATAAATMGSYLPVTAAEAGGSMTLGFSTYG